MGAGECSRTQKTVDNSNAEWHSGRIVVTAEPTTSVGQGYWGVSAAVSASPLPSAAKSCLLPYTRDLL